MRKQFIIALGITIALVLFFVFGRSIWVPIKNKIRGKKTVALVVSKIEPKVKKRIPDVEQLTDGLPLAILAFKQEEQIEVWKKLNGNWSKILSFPFTETSGKLGPKLAQGDLQIPEGIYQIESLNPNSSFYLSMKLNYPNDFDKKKGVADGRTNLGSDIFIHGKNATIGCIPIGDDRIEDLFYLVSQNGLDNIEVIISPYDMRNKNLDLKIETITWEQELYTHLQKALIPFL